MRLKIITYIAAVLVLAGLSLGIFTNSMTKPLGRDEQMYCTAGALLAQGKLIYRDFSYAAQMPYHGLLYAALFKIFDTTRYLFVGRMVSVICDILIVVCIFGTYRHIFGSFEIAGVLAGLAAAVLYVFNPLVDYANGFAWNHDVVILCVLLSFRLFISTDFQQKSKHWRIVVTALLLTFASCMRITTVLVQLLFFVFLLSGPAESVKQRIKTALPFLIATGLVLVWPLWTIARAPRAFFLDVFWIPSLYGEWLGKIGLVHNKFKLLSASLTTPGYFALIIIAVWLCVTLVRLRRNLAISNKRNTLLAGLLVLAFFIIAFIPPTMWGQYLAVPVPFIIIGLAYPLLYLRQAAREPALNRHFKRASVLVAVCAAVSVISYPVVLQRLPKLFNPQSWIPIQVHKVSEDIAGRLETKDSKLILTLVPLYALEGGCEIYPQLSCGSIIYRIADFMSPSDRKTTNTAGPETLRELVERQPPAAVIVGAEEMEFLEGPLVRTAVKPNWQRHIYDNGLIVHFRR